MSFLRLFFTVVTVLCTINYGVAKTPVLNQPIKANVEVANPVSYKNLSVYLIHDLHDVELIRHANSDTLKIVTLEEAMAEKIVRIYETGNVNQLEIENISKTDHVFIQSGDMIKGGRQDRTLPNDFLLKPESGRLSIDAFCVEQGRWAKRSGESDKEFSSSPKTLATKDLKIAARLEKSQGKVWENIAKTQDGLSDKVGDNVKQVQSPTSLQLTLENAALQKLIHAYQEKFISIVDDETNTVGFAFAINGQFNSADIYVSTELFKKLWPKLLEAAITEAISQHDEKQTFSVMKSDDVYQNVHALNKKDYQKQSFFDNTILIEENADNYYFSTLFNQSEKTILIHESVLAK